MPLITPEEMGEIPVKLEELTRNFEESVLRDISRRIAKAGTITETAEYQIIRMKELGYANDFLEKEIADYTKKSEAEIEEIFADTAARSDEFYSALFDTENKPYNSISESGKQLLDAGIKQTKNELRNFTGSMGFMVKNADGTTEFLPAAKAYQSALDLAQAQVSTGLFDYNTAIRNATKTLVDGGLRFVDYASGHVNRADVAVRRAVLTGVSQVTGKIAEKNAGELDTDLVEVTAHAGARPDHAEWQGRWYSLSGKSKKYRSLVDATGYGTGEGLKGWNCRHDFYPVIEGISVPAYTEDELKNIDPPPIEYNGKTLTYYECTQKQRKMETAMRKTKREIIAADGSGDKDRYTEKSILLRRQKEEYKKFSNTAGLLTQNERTQVYGFDRSQASRSSWAARKAAKNSGGVLTNGNGGGIMGSRSGKMFISSIEQPIEQQHTGKGNPNAILTYDSELNNRQKKLLKQLPEYDSRVIVPKKSVNMADLSALTAKTGDEYAMFTKGAERLVIRGNPAMVNISDSDAEKLAANGYRWSGHTHPGTSIFCMFPSDGDKAILKCFPQEQSVIYNSKGQNITFGKE